MDRGTGERQKAVLPLRFRTRSIDRLIANSNFNPVQQNLFHSTQILDPNPSTLATQSQIPASFKTFSMLGLGIVLPNRIWSISPVAQDLAS